MALEKKRDLKTEAELVLVNGKAKGLVNLDVDLVAKLIGHGEKFGKKRLAVLAEMQTGGQDINTHLKTMLQKHVDRPKAHEDMAKGANETFKKVTDLVEIFRIRPDLRNYLEVAMLEELRGKIVELQAALAS